MRCARRNADCDVANVELSDSVDRGDPDARVLGGDAFEHTPHLFVREALVSFVVEPGDLLSIGVIADDPVENANAARSGMLDGYSNLVERDLLLDDLAKNDGGTARDRRQHVDAITVVDRLRCIDEITVDCQAHALEEGRQRRKSIGDGAAQLGLRDDVGNELERRALTS
jgi:hypothetical protein